MSALPTRIVGLSLLLFMCAGCGRSGGPESPTGVGASSRPAARKQEPARPELPSTQTYKLTGVVRLVNPETGLVTIRHDPIPGFMGAMTMPFTVKDHGLLEDVRVGDEVEGELKVVREAGEVKDYELTALTVSRPAPAPGLTLNIGGGQPSLAPAPQLLKPGDPVPDFEMTGEDGKSLRLSDLRGKSVALTFIYTRCPLPDFCPRMDAKFADASERAAVGRGKYEKLRFISVSFDPEHDTPETLRQHARARGARAPLWTFAVASHPELSKVARPLGLVYGPGKDEVVHNLVVAVIGPDGKLVRLETGTKAREWPAGEIVKTMDSSIPGLND